MAIATTRGEVTARQVPRTCTVKSLMAEMNDEAPKLGPTMAVARGISWARPENSVIDGSSAKPSEPMMSGIRAPPVWPKYTNGMPLRTARSTSRAMRRLPTSAVEPRLTVMSSPPTITGRPPLIVPTPPIFPSPGVVGRSSGRIEWVKVPISSNELRSRPSGPTTFSRNPSMCSRTVRSPRSWSRATAAAPPISVRIRAARSCRSATGSGVASVAAGSGVATLKTRSAARRGCR